MQSENNNRSVSDRLKDLADTEGIGTFVLAAVSCIGAVFVFVNSNELRFAELADAAEDCAQATEQCAIRHGKLAAEFQRLQRDFDGRPNPLDSGRFRAVEDRARTIERMAAEVESLQKRFDDHQRREDNTERYFREIMIPYADRLRTAVNAMRAAQKALAVAKANMDKMVDTTATPDDYSQIDELYLGAATPTSAEGQTLYNLLTGAEAQMRTQADIVQFIDRLGGVA